MQLNVPQCTLHYAEVQVRVSIGFGNQKTTKTVREISSFTKSCSPKFSHADYLNRPFDG